MCDLCTPDTLLEAVRGLRVADPELGFKPLLAKLQQQQPDLGAATKEVREALKALQVESKANVESEAQAATAAPPAADEGDAPSPAALSLACFGCARLPSEMDDGREKHPVCPKCRKLKLLTTYWCCVNCPGNPGAWKLHAVYHKEVKRVQKIRGDRGVVQQRAREVAKAQARHAEQSGDKFSELLAKGLRYESEQDWRRAARTYREAIALSPEEPVAYFNLGAALSNSEHNAEAAQSFLEAKERASVAWCARADGRGVRGSELWARATASAFDMLRKEECDEVAKPEWWNDEGLKALSARALRAAPDCEEVIFMRAMVLSGRCGTAWEAGPRSAAEFREAATCYERTVALLPASALRFGRAALADWCRSQADAM
eukprot:scaffold30370_cov68-Phaeocystis_antarctica.AAC.2